MKIRKGRKRYLVVLNHLTNEVVLARPGRPYDWTISRNTLGLKMYDCTFDEAVHNIKVANKNGYTLIKKRY